MTIKKDLKVRNRKSNSSNRDQRPVMMLQKGSSSHSVP